MLQDDFYILPKVRVKHWTVSAKRDDDDDEEDLWLEPCLKRHWPSSSVSHNLPNAHLKLPSPFPELLLPTD